MPDAKKKNSDLKNLIKLCKKNTLGFAFAPGKEPPSDSIMVLHRSKDGKTLGKAAKKESAANKVAFGECSVEDKLMILKCEQVVPALAKTIKKYLKTQKISLNIQILDADANTIESDIEDLPPDPETEDDLSDVDAEAEDLPDDSSLDDDEDAQNSEENADVGTSDGVSADAIVQRIKAVQSALAAAPKQVAEKLLPALKNAAAHLKGQALDDAAQTLDKIEAVLAKLANAAPAVDPALQAKWEAASAKVAPLVDGALARGGHAVDKIGAAWNLAREKAEKADFEAALKVLPPLAKMLSQAQAETAPSEAQVQSQQEKDQEDRLKSAWTTILASLGPVIERTPQTHPAAAGKLQGAWAMAVKAADAGKFADALGIVKKVRAALALLPEAPPQTPDLQTARQSESSAPTGGTGAPPPQVDEGDVAGDVQSDQNVAPSQPDPVVAPAPEPAPPSDPVDVDAGVELPEFAPVDSSTLADHPALAKARSEYERVYKLARAFHNTVPTGWQTSLAEIDVELKPVQGTDAGIVGAAIAEATSALAKLEADIEKLTADREAWNTQKTLISVRIAVLNGHHYHDVEPVKSALAALVQKIATTEAKTAPAGFAFTDAMGDIPALLADSDKVEALADDYSHYEAIRGDREKRVSAPMLPAAIGYPVADQVRAQAIDTYKRAVNEEAANKRYEAAVTLLNRVPELCDRFILNRTRFEQYAVESKWLNAALEEINKRPQEHKALVSDAIKRMQERYDNSRINVTNDLLVSARMMNKDLILRERTTVLNLLDQVRDYVATRGTFDAKLLELENHEAREAAEEIITRMKADSSIAASSTIKRKFATALQILNVALEYAKEAKGKADALKEYKDLKKTVDKDLSETRENDKFSKATVQLGVADANITKAEEFRAARDYKAGTARLKTAQEAIKSAKSLLDMQSEMTKKMEEAWEGDVPEAADGLRAALDAYDKAKGYVVSKSGGVFDTIIQQADLIANEARGEVDTATTEEAQTQLLSKVASAKAKLDNAIDNLASKAAYDTLIAQLDAAVKDGGTLKKVNRSDCIQTEITALSGEKTDIEGMVAEPDLDFSGALVRLNAALRDAQTAEQKGTLYGNTREQRKTIRETRNVLSTRSSDAKAGMPSLTDKQRMKDARSELLTEYLTKAKEAWDAGNLKQAVSLWNDGAKRASGYEKLSAPMVDSVKEIQRLWIGQLHFIEAEPTVQIELEETKKLKPNLDALLDNHAFKAAEKLANSACGFIGRGYYILRDRDAYVQERNTNAKPKVEEIEAASNAGVADRVKEARQKYTDAERLAAQRDYAQAKKTLDALVLLCPDILSDAAAYKTFDDLRTAATNKLTQAASQDGAITVRQLLERLAAKLDNAAKLGEAGQYDKSNPLLTGLPAEIDAALARAASSAELDEAVKAVEDVANWDTIRAALDKLNDLRGSFAQHAGAIFLAERMSLMALACGRCDENIGGNASVAAVALNEAMDHAKWLQLNIGYFEQVITLVNQARTEIDARLKGDALLDFVSDDYDQLMKSVEDGWEQASQSGDVTEATRRIEEAMDRSHELRALAERHDKFMKRHVAVVEAIKELNAHTNRYGIKMEIGEATALSEQAGADAAGRNHDAAEKKISQAEETVFDARVTANMLANIKPTDADIGKILSRPDGEKQLDQIVETLDPSAKREVLGVAFKARFGCALNIYQTPTWDDTKEKWIYSDDKADDGDKLGPNIERYYKAMSDLPPSHTLGNDSMLNFRTEEHGLQTGSAYAGGRRKEILMREGDALTSVVYGFGLEHEIENVEEACQPANDDRVDFFNWNTLHEVGHAVDDQKGFMSSRAGNKSFGGWKEYSDPTPVAQAFSGAYNNYNPAYILQYMAGVTEPPMPPCPDGTDAGVWETARIRVRAHVDMARASNNPWGNASVAKQLNIGGTVYHEAYGGQWKSYLFAARSQAISGYQFRAPGEWFSEIYAAYYSGKLKGNHPCTPWLEALNGE